MQLVNAPAYPLFFNHSIICSCCSAYLDARTLSVIKCVSKICYENFTSSWQRLYQALHPRYPHLPSKYKNWQQAYVGDFKWIEEIKKIFSGYISNLVVFDQHILLTKSCLDPNQHEQSIRNEKYGLYNYETGQEIFCQSGLNSQKVKEVIAWKYRNVGCRINESSLIAYTPEKIYYTRGKEVYSKSIDSALDRLSYEHQFSAEVSAIAVAPYEEGIFFGLENGYIVHSFTRLHLSESLIFFGHLGSVTALYANEKILISGGRDKELMIWTLNPFILACRFSTGHNSEITCIHVIDKFVISADAAGFMYVWDIDSNSDKVCLDFHAVGVAPICFLQHEGCLVVVKKNPLIKKEYGHTPPDQMPEPSLYWFPIPKK